MVKIGVKPKKKVTKKIGFKPVKKQPVKMGSKPVKIQYGRMTPTARQNSPSTPLGGILAYTEDSSPAAYAQQQAITGELHNQYLETLTPGLNDLIGGLFTILQFLSDKKNWLTIGGIFIGILFVLLTVNALVQSEGKSLVSNALQSQGFTPGKRKKKK